MTLIVQKQIKMFLPPNERLIINKAHYRNLTAFLLKIPARGALRIEKQINEEFEILQTLTLKMINIPQFIDLNYDVSEIALTYIPEGEVANTDLSELMLSYTFDLNANHEVLR